MRRWHECWLKRGFRWPTSQSSCLDVLCPVQKTVLLKSEHKELFIRFFERIARPHTSTKQKNFHKGIRLHKTDVRDFDHKRSTVAEYSDVNDHRIDFENICIIAIEPNPQQRLFLESWLIQTPPGNLNRFLGSLPSACVNGLRNITDTKRKASR